MSRAARPHQVGQGVSVGRVVVVRKSTTLERQRLRPDAKLAAVLAAHTPAAGRITNAHEQHTDTFATVLSCLSNMGADVQITDNLTRRLARRADLIVTVGGDGTFLRASHCVEATELGDGAPMLGVNSAVGSSIGFFCSASRDNFAQRLEQLTDGGLTSRGLWRMRVFLNGRPLRDLALNDVLVAHQVPAETTVYTLKVDGRRQRQKSSGVWVSTAAGSTGAIRSAGGDVLPLDDRHIQFRVRELFPLSVAGPAVIGGVVGEALELHSHISRGVLYIDGGHRMVRFGAGDRITFATSVRPLPWIAAPDVDARRADVVASSEVALAAAGFSRVADPRR